jgi:hypothetical protein
LRESGIRKCAKNLAAVLTVQENEEAVVLCALENDLTMEMKMRNVT